MCGYGGGFLAGGWGGAESLSDDAGTAGADADQSNGGDFV